MATESPIRLLEGTEKWPPLNQSTRFGSSSSKITIKDLALLINDQRFQSLEKGLRPSRCESAPPSMEGSKKAIENIFSSQKSPFEHRLVYHTDPFSSSLHDYDEILDQCFADPIKSRWRHSFSPSCSTDGDEKLMSHAKCVDDPVKSPGSILPIREEESEDDGSSEQSSCLSIEKATMVGCCSGSVDSSHENSLAVASSAYDECHSSYKSVEETMVSDTELPLLSTLSNIISTSCTNDPNLDDMRQASSLDVASTTTNVEEEQDVISTTGAHIEAVKNFSVTNCSNSDFDKLHKQDQLIPQNNKKQISPQESNPSLAQGYSMLMYYPGINNSYGSVNQFDRGSISDSIAEVQPILQSSGFTPPLLATAPGFMTLPSPFYPNFQQPGFFSPQYGMGGYPFNSAVYPSYLHGFPYQGVVPLSFGGASFLNSGVPNGGNPQAYDMQNLKSYSQFGEHVLHLPVQDMYGVAYSNFGHQAPGAGAVLNQEDSHGLKKETYQDGLSYGNKSQHSAHPSYSRFNSQRGNMSSHYSFGRPTNISPFEQYPTAKHVGGSNSPGGRYNKSRSHFNSSGNPIKSYAVQSQSWSDANPCSFLEELKLDKGQRFELSDIAGHICEFSSDQHGSRFIQQKLETCSVEEKASVFGEVISNTFKLMNDVFGNYVIQKLFEYGSPDQRKDLANKLEGHILPLSLQMYGCRVIQKAIEVIDLEQKTRLVKELDGHVMRCVRDQNGNHVIQKCIESIPIDKIDFIKTSFRGQVATLSKHPYGCRVIQRVLEHCKNDVQTQFIVDELLDSICFLAQDQYGNYVSQHVLERGNPQERSAIIKKLSGSVVQLSQHKFASNVIEKCLECGDSASTDILIKEIICHGDKNDNLLIMMKDQYANYVIQKILQKCNSDQREVLLGLIRNHLPALKKYTYGKHLISRFEQLCNEAEL